jgi:hypothetical protein
MGHTMDTLIIPAVDITKLQVVKPKLHRTREYLAMIPIESVGLLPVGVNGRFFRNSSNSEEFDEDQSEEIEMRAELDHHRTRKHAYGIHTSEEHVIIQAFEHEGELKK